jgi:hypothetical protein
MQQIAMIRTLQLERTRLEAQRLAGELAKAEAEQRLVADRLDAQQEALRSVLQSASGLSMPIVANLNACIVSYRSTLRMAKENTRHAEERSQHQQRAYARSQQLVDLADSLVSQAFREHMRNSSQREADSLEDILRSRSVTA